MSIQKDQIRELIRSILRYLEPEIKYSEDAVELLMLTAAQESHEGLAKGILQMEPNTFISNPYCFDAKFDLYDNFLKYKPNLVKKIDDLKNRTLCTDDLLAKLNCQIAMARVYYYRVKEPLPSHKIVGDMASYYKRYYNTITGKATIQRAIDSYKRYCI